MPAGNADAFKREPNKNQKQPRKVQQSKKKNYFFKRKLKNQPTSLVRSFRQKRPKPPGK